MSNVIFRKFIHLFMNYPQIFLDGDRIGGFQELIKSDILDRKAAGNFDEEF